MRATKTTVEPFRLGQLARRDLLTLHSLEAFLKRQMGTINIGTWFFKLGFYIGNGKRFIRVMAIYLSHSVERMSLAKKFKCVFVSCLFSRQEYEAIKMNKKCQLRSMSEKHNFKNPHQIKSNYT